MESQTAVVSRVDTSDSSVELASGGRKALWIYNESTSMLYVLYGTGTASSTNYTVRVPAGGSLFEDVYLGTVKGIWASDDSSAAQVTELR